MKELAQKILNEWRVINASVKQINKDFFAEISYADHVRLDFITPDYSVEGVEQFLLNELNPNIRVYFEYSLKEHEDDKIKIEIKKIFQEYELKLVNSSYSFGDELLCHRQITGERNFL